MSLNDKQKRFAEEYIIDLNATQAAIRAGYSEKTAYSQGQRLLKHVEVQAFIQELQAKRAKRVEISQDFVLNELLRRCTVDIKDFLRFGPDGVYLKDSDEIDGTLISEVTCTPGKYGDSIKFKLHDNDKSLELLGKHLKLFSDTLTVQNPDGTNLLKDGIQISFVKAEKKKDKD